MNPTLRTKGALGHPAGCRLYLDDECTIACVVPENSEPIGPVEPIEPTALDGVAPPEPLTRGRALAEVVLCSGYPTQLAIALVLFGMFQVGPGPDGNPSPLYIIALLTTDTALLLGLMFAFMRRSNDRPAQLFLGWRPVASEMRVGLLTVPPILVLIVVVQLGLRAVAPSLHNVPISPFAGLMDSPWALAGFVVVLIIAGGLREELQRAFLLRRFEQQLGGARVGLVVTSLAFGLGHTLQGWDAAVGTAVLGAVWGAMYLARRSVVGTVTSHAVFNTLQAVMGFLVTTN
jgi:membrane protease YdiL (CAAX protease family)